MTWNLDVKGSSKKLIKRNILRRLLMNPLCSEKENLDGFVKKRVIKIFF